MTTSKKIDKSLLHAHENLYLTTCATLKELGCQKKFDIPSRQSSQGHVRKKNRFSKKKNLHSLATVVAKECKDKNKKIIYNEEKNLISYSKKILTCLRDNRRENM